jgi:hypothetical protein
MPSCRTAFVIGFIMMLTCAKANAADATLEELQRRLDAVKRESASAPKRSAPQSPSAGASPPRLVVQSDAPCELSVDGHAITSLFAAQPISLTVPVGKVTLECVSDTEPEARYARVYTLESGTKVTLQIELQGKVAALQRRHGAISP